MRKFIRPWKKKLEKCGEIAQVEDQTYRLLIEYHFCPEVDFKNIDNSKKSSVMR